MKYLRKFGSVEERTEVLADAGVSILSYTTGAGMDIHTYTPIPPTNLVISCSNNTVTITADNATTIEYNTDGASIYTTYTQPFAITQTVTVYAKATNSDGSITGSQVCEYVEPIDYSTPFYIDVRGAVTLAATSGLQMSTDKTTWTNTAAMTLSTGKTYFRVKTNQSTPLQPNWTEDSNSDYDIGGNINSLVKTNFENDTNCYVFYISKTGFFQNKSKLKSAGDLILPATTLVDNCYRSMFYKCQSLTTAPDLPATTLANYCYTTMFRNCTSLTTAPALPATTLADYCYNSMYQSCESLTTAPDLPATTLADYCYGAMFMGCSSLTTAPALPATTLANNCYGAMFYGCTNLNYIKCLATNISAESCTKNWVSSVAATGTFVKNPSMSSWTTGVNGIPTRWVVRDGGNISLEQNLNVATIQISDLDEGTGYYTINGGSHISVGNGTTTIPITQGMNGQVLLVHGEFSGEPSEETLTLSWTDYSPSVTITETSNYVTITSATADTIQYRLGSSGSFTPYTEPVYISTNTTIYVQATKTVSGVDYTTNTSQEVTHEPILPTNLVISCTNNFVTITATGADTLEYNMNGGTSFYVTYTAPFHITESGTVNARATNADGSITASQAVTYIDYRPTINITEANNYVTVTASGANTILYKLGTISEYVAYTGPVYIAENTTIYVQATRTVAGVDYTSTASQAVTHELMPPTNLVISCSNNFVTITANNATTLQYSYDQSTWNTYTQQIYISQTTTIYAKAINSDGEITASQQCIYVDYAPSVSISENNNYVTITSATADSITYRLGSSGSYTTYTAPVYIPESTTIYVIATRTVSGVVYTTNASEEVTHELMPPTNLVISCSNNTVTITATNATTLEYNTDGSSTYTTYTAPFAITQTVTVYAKATNDDGSITASQECEYSSGPDIPFSENCIFYAPLTQGDLTDHISGQSLIYNSNKVTWDSTKGMYRFGAVKKANDMYFPVDISNSIPNNQYTILLDAQPISYGGYVYPVFVCVGGYSDSSSTTAGAWRISLASMNQISSRSSRQYLSITINGNNGVYKSITNNTVRQYYTTTVGEGQWVQNWNSLMKSRIVINASRHDSYIYDVVVKDIRIYNFCLTDSQLLQAVYGE